MAFTIDPNTIEFNGDEAKEFNGAIFTQSFTDPQITELHDIIEGIVVKTAIPIIGGLNNDIGLGDNDCAEGREDNSISVSQKLWDPAPVSARLPFCWKTLDKTFLQWGLNAGLKKPDLTSGVFMSFIEEQLQLKLREMLLRIAYFSNTSADHFSNGGSITDSVTLGYVNKIDGFFTQIDAIVAADASRRTLGLDTRNAGTTYALQRFTAADTTNRVVTNVLQEMRFGADLRLRTSENIRFECTLSVADQYERELLAAEIPYSVERLENGVKMLKSAGIELVVMDFLDRMILKYHNDGTRVINPHRIILSTNSNMPVGTQNSGTFTEYSTIYDPIKKEVLVDIATELDAKILEDYMIQVAY